MKSTQILLQTTARCARCESTLAAVETPSTCNDQIIFIVQKMSLRHFVLQDDFQIANMANEIRKFIIIGVQLLWSGKGFLDVIMLFGT